MVALFRDALTNKPDRIDRTALALDATKLDRMSLGPTKGSVIKLWPDEDVTTGLVIGEGIETTLAAATRISHRGTRLQPAWAAGSATNLANFPVLTGVEFLTVLIDHDANGEGQRAASHAIWRWRDAGREAVGPHPKQSRHGLQRPNQGTRIMSDDDVVAALQKQKSRGRQTGAANPTGRARRQMAANMKLGRQWTTRPITASPVSSSTRSARTPEADPVAILLQFLVCFGNIVGRHNYILAESTRHHTNLFVALAGETSRGRKGTALERVKNVIAQVDDPWVENGIRGGLSSGEGLIYAVRDPTIKPDKNGNLVTVDAGVRDKRLLVIEPEFAGLLSVMERGGNTISPLLRKAWDGDRLETMTRTAPISATGAHISNIAHITISELRSRLTRTDMANGFANRYLFALIKRSKELPFGGSLSEQAIRNLGTEFVKIRDEALELVDPETPGPRPQGPDGHRPITS